MGHLRLIVGGIIPLLGAVLAAGAAAQERPPAPAAVDTRPSAIPLAALQSPSNPATPSRAGVPTEITLGVNVYPAAVYLTSYDAGHGQTYHIFGTNSTFDNMVLYYRTVLDKRGDSIFTEPAVHMFELGRFREDSMAFQPSVTIKDYAWQGSEGYLDPSPGGNEMYRTIIQIVPPPPTR